MDDDRESQYICKWLSLRLHLLLILPSLVLLIATKFNVATDAAYVRSCSFYCVGSGAGVSHVKRRDTRKFLGIKTARECHVAQPD